MGQISLKRVRKMTRAECKMQKNLFLILCTMLATGSVLTTIGICKDNSRAEFYLGICLFYGTVLVGYLLCVNLFRDMNSSQMADVKLSLPLNSKERYLSKIFSMFWMQLLPTLLAGIITFLCSYFIFWICGKNHFVLLEIPKSFFKTAVSMGMMVLFTNALVFLCCVTCGTYAESCYFSMILLFCIMIMPVLFGEYLIGSFSGVSKGNAITFGNTFYSSVFSVGERTDFWYVYMAVQFLLAVLVFIGSGYLYKKRDGQGIGAPFVFRFVKMIFMFLGAFTLMIVFSGLGNEKIGLILTFLIYFIIDLIIKRGRINVWEIVKSIFSYILIVVIFIGITTTAYFTNGFGYSKISEGIKKNQKTSLFCTIYRPWSLDSGKDEEIDFSLYQSSVEQEGRQKIIKVLQEYRTYEPKNLKTCYEQIVYNDEENIRKENYRVEVYINTKEKGNYEYYRCSFYLPKEKVFELENEIQNLEMYQK